MASGRTKEELMEFGGNTKFSKTRQPNKYRQPDTISGLMKKELASDGWATFEEAEILNEEGRPTGQKVTVRVKLTTAQAIAKRLLSNAAKGRERSIEIVLERTEGKVPQNLNLGGKDGETIVMPVPFIVQYSDEEPIERGKPKASEQASEKGQRKAG
jgi:hypothetical protein